MSVEIRVELAPDWAEALRGAQVEFFASRLGPDMLADAQRYVPVDTGRLEASLDYQVVDESAPELHVGSYADDEGPVEYAAAVELGFHGEEVVRAHTREGHPVREHTRMGNTPAQPYLRPTLYQERYI